MLLIVLPVQETRNIQAGFPAIVLFIIRRGPRIAPGEIGHTLKERAARCHAGSGTRWGLRSRFGLRRLRRWCRLCRHFGRRAERSEERRVGEEWVSTGRSGWWPDH